jgi:hypothetical protein
LSRSCNCPKCWLNGETSRIIRIAQSIVGQSDVWNWISCDAGIPVIQCIEGLDAELEGNSLPYFEILKDGKAVLSDLVRTLLIVAVEIAVPNSWAAFCGLS